MCYILWGAVCLKTIKKIFYNVGYINTGGDILYTGGDILYTGGDILYTGGYI